MIRRISLPLLALFFGAVAFGRDEYTRTFDKTVAWHPGERVSVEHRFGNVTIKTHSSPEVIIHADIKVSARDGDRARNFADNIEILVETAGSEVSIRTRYPGHEGWFHNASYAVHYDLTIPETAPLTVRNSFGAVSVTGMKADSDIKNSYGTIDFRDGHGNQRLETSFAAVRIGNNVGDVEIEGSYGAVTAEDINGALTVGNRFAPVTVTRVSKGASVRSGNGTVTLTNIGSSANVRTSFAAVHANNIAGGLMVENSYGAVQVSDAHGAEVATSFAPVVLDRIAGPLHVTNQYGAVDATSATSGACQPITIRTSFSAVRVRLPADASYRITARTSYGHIRTDFPLSVSGSLSTDNVTGTIGSGACEMSLTDNNGAIEILKSGS